MTREHEGTTTTANASSAQNIQDIVTKARTLIGRDDISDPLSMEIIAAVSNIGEQVVKRGERLVDSHQYGTFLRALETLLQSALEHSASLSVVEQEPEQYSEDWWEDTRQVLRERIKADAVLGWEAWLTTYASALANWRLDICENLVSEQFVLPVPQSDQFEVFAEATYDLYLGFYDGALDMLTQLVDMTGSQTRQPLVQVTDRFLLIILLGRIHLYILQSADEAKARFEQAQELMPDMGLPATALGEYQRLDVHEDAEVEQIEVANLSAMQQVRQALGLPSAELDATIGMGLLLEDNQKWDAADNWYRRALEMVASKYELADVDVVAAELDRQLRPVSANVYLQLGRMLSKRDPESALHAFDIAIGEAEDRALRFRLRHDGSYTERIGYRLKAQLLARGKRLDEAAEAYYEAGERFLQISENHIGIDLLQRARAMNPRHAPTCWELADAFRIESFRPDPPYVDESTITESRNYSENGFALELPGAADSWVYTSRALIEEQRGRLPSSHRAHAWWEALTYLERAIAHDRQDPNRWENLARIYNSMDLYAACIDAAMTAIAQITSVDPQMPMGQMLIELEVSLLNEEADDRSSMLAVLSEYATALANSGQFDDALQVIGLYQRLDSSASINNIKSYIFSEINSFAAGLDAISMAIADAPGDLWSYEQRAICLRGMKERRKARSDIEWIRKQCRMRREQGVDDIDNLVTYAWAAFSLGSYDESRSILERLLGDVARFGISPTYSSLLLGTCYIALNELERAEELIHEGIRRAGYKRELTNYFNDELTEAERASAKWPHGAEARELIGRLRSAIQMRIVVLEENGLPTADEELKLVIENLRDDDASEGWSQWVRVGARAGLARLYGNSGRWEEAADLYTVLIAEDANRSAQLFPEARLGLMQALEEISSLARQHDDIPAFVDAQWRLAELDPTRSFQIELEIASAYEAVDKVDQALNHLRAALDYADSANDHVSTMILMGDMLANASRWDEARQHYADASDALATADYDGPRTTIQLRLGIAAVVHGDLENAIKYLRDALHDASALFWFDDYASALISSARLLSSTRHHLDLSEALRLLSEDKSLDELQRNTLELAQLELRSYTFPRLFDDTL